MTKLVIVESPTKARTIKGYLPDGYIVLASMGHIRDLPSSASEIPTSLRDKEWSRLGVNVEAGFEPLYVLSSRRKDTLKELRAALKKADELIIATDEDREGESIGWHLIEVLKPKVPVKRMVFHEITKEAIQEALSDTRDVDDHLVRAQETRRILDRLVGYTLSPLLWRKIAPRLSAGRVQSAAVRLLVERERERHAFRSGSYWDIDADFTKRPDAPEHHFKATLRTLGGKRLATGKDFDDNSGRLKPASKSKVLLLDQTQVEALRDKLTDADFQISELSTRNSVRKPYPPFTTSTLQQEAGRKLRLAARQTMRVAQTLYENGYITYHRTDSVHLSDQAVSAARTRIGDLYGKEYLTAKPRQYKTKAKAAQEAHEAIRPSGADMRPVADLPLSGDERKLYDLIWKRTMATQMADARLEFVTADITASVEEAVFRASGRRVVFPGFFRAYVEGSDDPDAAIEDRDAPLPELAEGESVDAAELQPVGHETKPPARFTEASLVKALEAAGVGRPSTYATILGTIQDRGYVNKSGSALAPTYTAFAVTGLLESDFEQLVDLNFTAQMEQDLDGIAAGEIDWLQYLEAFYNGDKGLETQVEEAAERIEPRAASTVELGEVEVRIGRYGPFIEITDNGERRTVAIPEDLAPGDLSAELVAEMAARAAEGDEALGVDPETELPVYLKDGPYGPYVQLGEAEKGAPKPKRVSLPKTMEPGEVTLEIGLKLLALPRPLGPHPESGEIVKAGIGRYGPYVVHQKTFASLQKDDDVLDVDLDRAMELFAAKAERGGRRQAKVLKELGVHPETEEPVNILDGRYGPYVNHQRTNASLPKGTEVDSVDLAKGLELLAARAAKAGTKKKGGRKKKS
jgi:DNA topoisomerase-1